jgi:GntR family transcriptional repressor for pyruvate dehydrogenase complex
LSPYLREGTRNTRANEARRVDFAQQVLIEHLALVEAIEHSDPLAAIQAATTHMQNASRRLQSADPDFWAQHNVSLTYSTS